eukprot:s3059_g1.t3
MRFLLLSSAFCGDADASLECASACQELVKAGSTDLCSTWAQGGACQQTPDFMMDTCKGSCNQMAGPKVISPASAEQGESLREALEAAKARIAFLEEELAASKASTASCPSELLVQDENGNARAKHHTGNEEEQELLLFYAGRIRCDGDACNAGLLVTALRAALQQSFQLLLDGFLVLLNEGLGADPEKGRAAAAQAARIMRKIRERLKAKASTKIGELQERLQKEVATSDSMSILAETASKHFQEAVEFSEMCRRRLQALLETARSKMPEQDQELLPDQPDSFLRDHLLVGAWLVLFVHVLCGMIGFMLRSAFKCLLVWPCRCFWAVCRGCICCLCPCGRKVVEERPSTAAHANGAANGASKKPARLGSFLLSDCSDTFNMLGACVAIQSLASASPQGSTWRSVLVFLRRLESASVELDHFSFNSVLGVCEPSGAWTLALSLFASFFAQRFRPDDVSYMSMLCSLSDKPSLSRRWLHAAHLLGRMTASPAASGEAAVATAVVSAQCMQWPHGLEVVRRLKHTPAQGSAAAAVVGACVAARSPRPAAAVLTELNDNIANLQRDLTWSYLVCCRSASSEFGGWGRSLLVPAAVVMLLRRIGIRPPLSILQSVQSGRAFSSTGRSLPHLTRRRVAALTLTGLSGVALINAEVHKWLWDEFREATHPNRAEEREALAKAHERERQQEVERLRSEASIWRLLQLAVIMLPVAIYFPVWIVDPTLFWTWVSARIDRAGPCFVKHPRVCEIYQTIRHLKSLTTATQIFKQAVLYTCCTMDDFLATAIRYYIYHASAVPSAGIVENDFAEQLKGVDNFLTDAVSVDATFRQQCQSALADVERVKASELLQRAEDVFDKVSTFASELLPKIASQEPLPKEMLRSLNATIAEAEARYAAVSVKSDVLPDTLLNAELGSKLRLGCGELPP